MSCAGRRVASFALNNYSGGCDARLGDFGN
jgi:hypothetical protein